MTQLIVSAKSPACANSRTKADTVLTFDATPGKLSLAAMAREIDSRGKAAVDEYLKSKHIKPARGNRPGTIPASGHGVVVVYSPTRRRTFHAV